MIARALAVLAVVAFLAGGASAVSIAPVLEDVELADLAGTPKGGLVFVQKGQAALFTADPGASFKVTPVPPSGDAELAPVALALLPDGGAWVAEAAGRRARARLIGADGKPGAVAPVVALSEDAAVAPPVVTRAADGSALMAFGPQVLRVSADASKVTTVWEAPADQRDLFTPVGIAEASDGGVAVLERFSAQLWVIDSKGQLAWKLGGRGTQQGVFGEALSLTSLQKDGETVLVVSHRSGGASALSFLDRFGYFFTRIDGPKADLVRADAAGRLLLFDRSGRSVAVLGDVSPAIAFTASPDVVKHYDAWRAAARAGDKPAAEKLVAELAKLPPLPTSMRAAVFRILARLGFTAAADAEVEKVLTESPGRVDLLGEAIEHAAQTGRLARGSQLLEKFDWLVQDAADKDRLSMELLKLREQAISKPR